MRASYPNPSAQSIGKNGALPLDNPRPLCYANSMKQKHWFRCLFACLLPLLAAGCQSARMAVPADLETRSEVLPCIGRGGFSLVERFSFGPYQVSDVHRGWTRRFSWSIAVYGRSKARQELEFTLQAPSGKTWQGQAVNGVRQSDLKDTVAGGELTWGLTRDVSYVARLGLAGQSNAWTLALAEVRGDVVLVGSLTDGATTYRIEGTRQLAGTSMPLMENAGFLVYHDSRLVAAIDLVNAGSVRFDKDLSPSQREPLAAAAAALLLYRDISRD